MTVYIIQNQDTPTQRIFDIYPSFNDFEGSLLKLTMMGIDWSWTKTVDEARKYNSKFSSP